MINLHHDKFKSTLKEISKDSSNKEYMTESDKEVIDFDEVKDFYIKDICPKSKPYSNDGLLYIGDEFYFIEFKNGNIKNIKNVIDKVLESLLIFCDITNKTISYTRTKGHYILVYNHEKSIEYIKNQIDKEERCSNNLGSEEIQESLSFNNFIKSLSDLSNYNVDFFGLRAKFQKMYFKTVITYDIERFEKEFIDKLS